MPLTKLQFRPGINREVTSHTNEGGWQDCDKVRFRFGFPEKIGGWRKLSSISLVGGAEMGVLKERWEKGPIFHYEHEDTQGIVQVIQSQEPTFDAEAAWSEGEALWYEDDV